ncbi:MAG: prepilin-type N-terminal cleavage/methylation domain-containing protein [Urechidicola sp.]|nr:prepilin-type N-terminal cleavage/methylation domain-containing protein [Urechidicola sp.]
MNKKIKSFTLSEMMVVLVISAIVISLAITVLNLVQQQIKSINTNYEKNTELRLLERALQYDFNKGEVVYNSRDSLLISHQSTDNTIYEFHKNYILRNNDTLHFKIIAIQPFVNGQPVATGAVDALSLTLMDEIKNKELFFFKPNDATFYMNNDGF